MNIMTLRFLGLSIGQVTIVKKLLHLAQTHNILREFVLCKDTRG